MILVTVLSLLLVIKECNSPQTVCENFLVYQKKQKKFAGTKVVMLKGYKTLCYFKNGKLKFSAKASYGRKEGKKRFVGDQKTPEGEYTLFPARKSKKFGLFMLISYPSPSDIKFAKKHGKNPGGSVGVHGPQKWYSFLGKLQAVLNHSDGCIVLDKKAIKKLSKLIKRKTKIVIYPVNFRPF